MKSSKSKRARQSRSLSPQRLSPLSVKSLETRYPCLKSPNITLKPHQAQAAVYLLHNRGLLAYWGTGTGKTLAAAAAASCLLKEGVVSKVIVLTKKSALAQPIQGRSHQVLAQGVPVGALCVRHSPNLFQGVKKA